MASAASVATTAPIATTPVAPSAPVAAVATIPPSPSAIRWCSAIASVGAAIAGIRRAVGIVPRHWRCEWACWLLGCERKLFCCCCCSAAGSFYREGVCLQLLLIQAHENCDGLWGSRASCLAQTSLNHPVPCALKLTRQGRMQVLAPMHPPLADVSNTHTHTPPATSAAPAASCTQPHSTCVAHTVDQHERAPHQQAGVALLPQL